MTKKHTTSGFYNTFYAGLILIGMTAGADELLPTLSQTFMRTTDGTIEVLVPRTYDYANKCDPTGKNCKESLPGASWIFEKENPLLETSKMGVNYAFMKDGTFITVSANGNLNLKGNPARFNYPFSPGLLGGNYFLKAGTDQIVTIGSNGFYYDTLISAGKIKAAGGNYFITDDGVLTTINAAGIVYRANPPVDLLPENKKYWIYKDVSDVGGQFFVKYDGTVVSVSSSTGFYYNYAPGTIGAKPMRVGGNYYIGQDNNLYTFNYDGAPAPHGPIPGVIALMGYSYIIYIDGSFSIIAEDGSVHTQAAHLSTTGVTRKIIKNIDLKTLDMTSIYLPTMIR